MDEFDTQACSLQLCTITDKTKPCPMYGCQRAAKALRAAHAAGVEKGREEAAKVWERNGYENIAADTRKLLKELDYARERQAKEPT